MIRSLFRIAALLVGALPPTLALADDTISPGVTLAWSAPAGCPDEKSVRASITSLLREATVKSPAPENPTNGAASFEAVVTKVSGGFDLIVRVRSATGDEGKSIHGDTCPTVADAFALVVAFAVDPNLAGHEAPPPASSAAAAANVHATPNAPAAPQHAESPSGPIPVAIGVSALGSAGTLPFPGLGVGAVVAVGERPRWEIAGSYWPDRQTSKGTSSGRVALVDVRLITVRPSACFPLSSGIDLCSGVEVGQMAAGSTGVTGPSTGRSWWFSLSAGLAARIPLTRATSLRARFDVGIPFSRPNFVIERSPAQADAVWQPSPVFGMLSIEPELRLSPTDGERSGQVR